MWFDIVKTNKTRHFLLEVFNIPYEADITFPQNLLQSFSAASNENLITEQKFNSLLELSNQGKYQEVVDSLDKMLKDARKARIKEQQRKYKQKPEYKEQQRKYRQTPEFKEKERKRYHRRKGAGNN